MINDETQVTDDTLQEETSEEETNEEVEEQEEEKQEEKKDWEAEAKKWEAIAKRNKDKQKATKPADLTSSDVIYLAKADIHEDDIEYITELAKNNKLSLKEAHKQFQPLLDVRNEERRTAQATETKSGRGKKPSTGDDYLRKAEETGEIPTDDKSMQDMILARQNRFRRK